MFNSDLLQSARHCLDVYLTDSTDVNCIVCDNLKAKIFRSLSKNGIEYSCAFEGTNEIEDWYFNLNLFADPDSQFRGFAKAYKQMRNSIWSMLIRTEPTKNISSKFNRECSLKFTGHSLGGAIATHAHLDFLNHGIDNNLITFASPKILRRNTPIKQLEASSHKRIRVFNNFDPVHHAPLILGKHIPAIEVETNWLFPFHKVHSMAVYLEKQKLSYQ